MPLDDSMRVKNATTIHPLDPTETQPHDQQQHLEERLTNSFNTSGVHHCINSDGQNLTLPDQLPRFIVFGTQKGGTTALTEILKHHPKVMANKLAPREPHYFDFYVTKREEPFLDPAFLCSTRERYIRDYFDLDAYQRASKHGPVFAFEKTPSYIRYVGTARRIYQTLGRSIKLIAVLRNPVERSYSSYKMEYLRGFPLDTSFDELIQNEIEALRQAGLINAPPVNDYGVASRYNASFSFDPIHNLSHAERRTIVANTKTPQQGRLKKMKDNTIYTGMYATQLSEWLQYYELGVDVLVIASERMRAHLDLVLREVQEFLELPLEEFHESVTSKDYNPLEFRGVQTLGKQVDRPSKQTLSYLKEFFRPYNDELADLLGEEWRRIWE